MKGFDILQIKLPVIRVPEDHILINEFFALHCLDMDLSSLGAQVNTLNIITAIEKSGLPGYC